MAKKKVDNTTGVLYRRFIDHDLRHPGAWPVGDEIVVDVTEVSTEDRHGFWLWSVARVEKGEDDG